MTAKLRNMILAGFGTLMLLAPASAEAQMRPCAPHERGCVAPLRPGPQPGPAYHPAAKPLPPHLRPAQVHRPAPPAVVHRHAKPQPVYNIRPGHSAARGRPFHRGKNSRFHAPPRGQEYRVVNDHLVLADSRTLQIVAVLGLMNTLLR